jgi:hypothetical protein
MTQQEYLQLIEMSLSPMNRLSAGKLQIAQAVEESRRQREAQMFQDQLLSRRQEAADAAMRQRLEESDARALEREGVRGRIQGSQQKVALQAAASIESARRQETKDKTAAAQKAAKDRAAFANDLYNENSAMNDQLEQALTPTPQDIARAESVAAQVAGLDARELGQAKLGRLRDPEKMGIFQSTLQQEIMRAQEAKKSDPRVISVLRKMKTNEEFIRRLDSPYFDVEGLRLGKQEADKALESSPNGPKTYEEAKMQLQFYDIPMPDEFKAQWDAEQAAAAVAKGPPDTTRADYGLLGSGAKTAGNIVSGAGRMISKTPDAIEAMIQGLIGSKGLEAIKNPSQPGVQFGPGGVYVAPTWTPSVDPALGVMPATVPAAAPATENSILSEIGRFFWNPKPTP